VACSSVVAVLWVCLHSVQPPGLTTAYARVTAGLPRPQAAQATLSIGFLWLAGDMVAAGVVQVTGGAACQSSARVTGPASGQFDLRAASVVEAPALCAGIDHSRCGFAVDFVVIQIHHDAAADKQSRRGMPCAARPGPMGRHSGCTDTSSNTSAACRLGAVV
jgi:hypothetical protein